MCFRRWCPGRWYFPHHTWTLRASFVTWSRLCQRYFTNSEGEGSLSLPFFFFPVKSTWHSAVWYDIDFADFFLLDDAQLRACEHDRRSQVKHLCLPILCCVSITVCCLFSWLIDQLSCSLLNGEQSFAVIDTLTPLKDLSRPFPPPTHPLLLSKSYLQVFKAVSGFH